MTDVAYQSASSDGSRIEYTSEETGSWQVWVMNADGSHRRQLTDGSDSVDFAVWVPHDPHTILYSKSVGGSAVDQFFYVRDDRPGSVPVFPNEALVTHQFGAFSPDGSQLAFTSNQRTPGSFDVYVVDRRTGAERRLMTVVGMAYATAWSPDGKSLLVRRVYTPYDDDLFVIDVQSGRSRLLTAHTGEGTFTSAQFTPDMRQVTCVTDLHREFASIVRIDLRTGVVHQAVALHHDVDQVVLSPDGQTMAYIVNLDGYGDVYVANAQTGAVVGSPSMPPYIAENMSFTDNGRVLLYAAEGPTFPKVVWTYDLHSHRTRRLFRPNLHGIPPSSIVEPSVVHVRSFDGTIVPAWYFKPKNPHGKLTVLLDIHGGPELQDRAWFYPFAQYLASRGYALLDPNIRGSTGYGRRYLHLADQHRRLDAIRDIKALHDWLIADGGANPRNIFINGGSYGGFAVLSSLYRYPHAFAGGIDVFGVADLIAFLETTEPAVRSDRERIYGTLAHDRAFLASISPINHVSEIRRPLLVVAGANDTHVSVTQSMRIAAALRKIGTPVELHIFPSEGHGISHIDDLIAYYTWAVNFIRRYAH